MTVGRLDPIVAGQVGERPRVEASLERRRAVVVVDVEADVDLESIAGEVVQLDGVFQR